MKIKIHTLDLDKELIVPICKIHQFCHLEEICSKDEKCFEADLVEGDSAKTPDADPSGATDTDTESIE